MGEAKLLNGTLAVTAKKAVRLDFTNAKGKSVNIAAPLDQLSAELLEQAKPDVSKLSGKAVEFEMDGPNKAVRIRVQGSAWTPGRVSGGMARQPERSRGGPQRRGDQSSNQGTRTGQGPRHESRAPRRVVREFHHAYNFVPAPPRSKNLPADLNDHEPPGHHRYSEQHLSGWIDVELRTVTPLLIPDAMNVVEDALAPGHKHYFLRTDPDGRPYLPPTSVKGMLRAAYEAVTNSRFGVFAGHQERLAYRMPARDGLKLVPAVVENGRIILQTGTSQFNAKGQPLYAAWLEKYSQGRVNWKGLDRHRRRVWAYVTLWKHRNFQFWNVAELRPDAPTAPTDSPADRRRPGRSMQPVTPTQGRWVRGYVFISEKNIDRKHDERVFFTEDPNPPSAPLDDEHHRQWKRLIADYQEIHADERQRGITGPPAMRDRRTIWSRHISGGRQERELSDGTLCYADVEFQRGQLIVRQLYPVNISRKLHARSPDQLLEPRLKPAQTLGEFSPADRVFGMVGRDAYRGHLRIGSVRCESDDAIETFEAPGIPLAILGAAKPQQARFYLAKTPGGEAQTDGIHVSEAGYDDNHALRGRKVFPHHHGAPDDPSVQYWDQPTEDRTQISQAGWHQEYHRPTPPPDSDGQVRDDQNRSIRQWVRPGATFTFRVHVTNLTQVELGALFWLLSLEPGQFHRLGGGKPLGFGSVRLSMKGCDLRDGQAWQAFYTTLHDDPRASGQHVVLGEATTDVQVSSDGIVQCYQAAVAQAYGDGNFRRVSFIKAFLQAATGFADRKPVHYPRLRRANGSTAPDPAGENFKWFGENEANHRLALPNLDEEEGLPYFGT